MFVRFATRLLLTCLVFSCLLLQPASAQNSSLSRPSANPSTTSDPTSPTAMTSEGSSDAIADKWAVVVGVSKYQDPTIPPVPYADNDARNFADFLVNEEHFAKDHVHVLIDQQATREAILREVGDSFFPHAATKNDMVLFYFSGHGSPAKMDIAHMNYLVAYDTKKSSLFATGIAVRSIPAIMHARVKSAQSIIILDAPHCGAAVEGDEELDLANNVSNRGWLEPGQIMLCSSSGQHKSWGSKRCQNSVFTHHLIEILQKAGPEAKISDMFGRIRQATEDEVKADEQTEQHPVIQTFAGGSSDIKLGVIPSSPRELPDLSKTAVSGSVQEPK